MVKIKRGDTFSLYGSGPTVKVTRTTKHAVHFVFRCRSGAIIRGKVPRSLIHEHMV